jgi:hypothetical protein
MQISSSEKVTLFFKLKKNVRIQAISLKLNTFN